jgi:hypothetical protein
MDQEIKYSTDDREILTNLQEQTKCLPEIRDLLVKQNGRLTKVENNQKWLVRIGSGAWAMLAAFVATLKFHFGH